MCFKMSMSTSYRYEIENPSAKTLRKALQRQEQRIRVSEILTKIHNAVPYIFILKF